MLRCMIIDDSSVVRTVASRIMMRGRDVHVLEAPTARSGFDICADNMPEIVIVDGDLPDRPGVELLEELCELDHNDRSSVLLLLSEMDLSSIMRAKRAGAAGFLLKPFDRTSFLEVVGPLMDARGGKPALDRAA